MVPWDAKGTSIVRAEADGFFPEEILLSKDSDSALLVLQRLGSLRIKCETLDGQPLAGVRVAVSHTVLPRTGDAPYRASGTPYPLTSKSSVAEDTTRDDGEVVLDRLPQGRCYVSAIHGTWILVDKSAPAGPTDVAQSTDIRLTFAPIVCAFAVVKDDNIVQSIGGMPGSVQRTSTVDHLSDRLAEVYERLRSIAGQEALITVAASNHASGHYTAIGARARFEVFTERHGIVQVPVTVQKLEEGIQPDVVTLGPAEPAQTANVRVQLRTPSGRTIEPHGVYLIPATDARGRLWVPAPASTARRLPVGQYRIKTNQPWLSDELADRATTVSHDGVMTLDLSQEVSLCRIVGRHLNGSPIDTATVRITSVGTERSTFFSSGLLKARWILPTGATTVSVHAPGCNPVATTLSVPSVDGTWSIDVGLAQ